MCFLRSYPARVLCAVLLIQAFSLAATADVLRIGGTGNALGSMQLLAEAFSRAHPETQVMILPSIGSSGAIRAVPRGAIDIGLSARSLTAEELGDGTTAIEYGRTPTVFAVHQRTDATNLTLSQVEDIYRGRLQRWPDGERIRPILRQQGDDNTRQLRDLSPAVAAAIDQVASNPAFPFATTDQEASDKLESIPGALSITALSLILSEQRPFRALSLEGVEPTPANIASGLYPIFKRYYFIVPRNPSTAAKAFIDYARSSEGISILVRTGHYIPTDQSRP